MTEDMDRAASFQLSVLSDTVGMRVTSGGGGLGKGTWSVRGENGFRESVRGLALPASQLPDDLMHRAPRCQEAKDAPNAEASRVPPAQSGLSLFSSRHHIAAYDISSLRLTRSHLLLFPSFTLP